MVLSLSNLLTFINVSVKSLIMGCSLKSGSRVGLGNSDLIKIKKLRSEIDNMLLTPGLLTLLRPF